MHQVISNIKGGLGNQLFQFCFSREFARRKNAELYLDLSWYENFNYRGFQLNEFFESDKEYKIYSSPAFTKKNGIPRKINKLVWLVKNDFTFVREKNLFYNESYYFKRGKKFYIEGYWLSYKYLPVSFEINFKNQNSLIRNKYFNLINESHPSVAIHIRRGDYEKKNSNSIHGLLPISYYKKAISMIEKNYNNPNYFVFSDDLNWVRENLKLASNVCYVDNNNDAILDLFLMCNCKINIIANSTFSWWGAWLNKDLKEIIIAPKNWFINKKYSQDDIIPSNWIVIE